MTKRGDLSGFYSNLLNRNAAFGCARPLAAFSQQRGRAALHRCPLAAQLAARCGFPCVRHNHWRAPLKVALFSVSSAGARRTSPLRLLPPPQKHAASRLRRENPGAATNRPPARVAPPLTNLQRQLRLRRSLLRTVGQWLDQSGRRRTPTVMTGQGRGGGSRGHPRAEATPQPALCPRRSRHRRRLLRRGKGRQKQRC